MGLVRLGLRRLLVSTPSRQGSDVWHDRGAVPFFLFLFLSSGGWGKKRKKLKLTTLPRTFIHVACRINSISFAIQLVFWRVLSIFFLFFYYKTFSERRHSSTTPNRRNTILVFAILTLLHYRFYDSAPPKPAIFYNERFTAARQEEGR